MKNYRKLIGMPCFALCLGSLVGCGGGSSSSFSSGGSSSSASSGSASSSSSSSSEEEDPAELLDKTISSASFDDPSLADRPLVMCHSSTTDKVDDIYNRGYGGIVTNVAWNSNYLNDDLAFNKLEGVLDHAIDDKKMRVWLYDEYGYPSGTAHGQTLKGHPEYEALGLVVQYKPVAVGETVTVSLLHGHKAIEAAYAFNGASQDEMDLTSSKNVSSGINSDKTEVSYTNSTDQAQVLVSYMSKQWYENTHSMENWYAQQRYINMLESGGPERFIDLTYNNYYKRFSERFGKGIEAFFTDEPALQGNYFDITERNREVIDTPDMTIPVVECLNYSATLFSKFKETYNYDLEPLLGYLYKDDGSVGAKQVRMDFYNLTSELFRTNYLGAISSWCSSKGVKSSGHLLLEENLYQNVWFAGNMIQLTSTMGIPGSDMLYSKADTTKDSACITDKLVSSGAAFAGKYETFAEISGAFDNTAGDMYHQLNAVGVQVLNGINNFASYYYQGNQHTLAEDQIFSTAIGRMRYMSTGSLHRAKTAVYYPYEGAAAETLPTTNLNKPTDNANGITSAFNDVLRELTSKQVDYSLVDATNLSKCKVKDGALVSPDGERYESIVIPTTTAIRSEALLKLIEAKAAGVEIILENISSICCERGADDIAARWSEVKDGAEVFRTSVAIAKHLRENGTGSLKLDEDRAGDIYTSKRENKNYYLYTVCNAYDEDKEYEFTLDEVGKSLKVYNPVEGTIDDIEATFNDNNTTYKATLPANRTVFFLLSK